MLAGSHGSPPTGGGWFLFSGYHYSGAIAIAVTEKRGRGRPKTGIGPNIGLRLYPDMEAAIAAWIKRQPDPKPSRSEAIRRLIEKGMAADRGKS
jgi:hypothetical protein